MKVALAFPGCHRRAGVERVVWECARYLAGKGHSVTVFASEWEECPGGRIEYIRVPRLNHPWFLRGWSFFRNCSAMYDPRQFDVLNTHGCVCPTGGVHWAQSIHHAWLARSREMRHPLSPVRLRQRLNPLHPVLLRLEKLHFAERAYRKVIATTEQVRADLRQFLGVPEQDVVIVPNGFSPEEFNPGKRHARRPAARERLGLGPRDIALLFVAHELERKGYRTILDAMNRLRRPELRLLVVGRADRKTAESLASSLGLSGQVLCCGPTADVSEYHAAADLFVLPTQYEAFCLAILEALGSGLPVVTSSVPGARDAIQPGVNGDIIQDPNNGEQLAAALEPYLEEDFRLSISARVPDTVAAYQWPNVLARYEKVLEECTH